MRPLLSGQRGPGDPDDRTRGHLLNGGRLVRDLSCNQGRFPDSYVTLQGRIVSAILTRDEHLSYEFGGIA